MKVGNVSITKENLIIIGGPCSVESKEQIFNITNEIKDTIDIVRGGAFKPRTSPYAFQGLGFEAIDFLNEVKNTYHLPIISEIMSEDDVEYFEKNVDIIQVGTRNMQNYSLLKKLGSKTTKPILLKRGYSATIDEFVNAAEYIKNAGNPNVILCERGIRTFETAYRNTLDLSAVVLLKQITDYPVFVDPSHAAGRRDLLEGLSKAAVAAGCDGLLFEVHTCPDKALSDGQQSLTPKDFKHMLHEIKKVANAVGKKMK